jgi:hypothetical protein
MAAAPVQNWGATGAPTQAAAIAAMAAYTGAASPGAALPFYAAVACHRPPHLWDLHSSLAVMAVVVCRSDGAVPGYV